MSLTDLEEILYSAREHAACMNNDLELAAGFCGSVSGSIFVTVGQPHIKVDSITVGGR